MSKDLLVYKQHADESLTNLLNGLLNVETVGRTFGIRTTVTTGTTGTDCLIIPFPFQDFNDLFGDFRYSST